MTTRGLTRPPQPPVALNATAPGAAVLDGWGDEPGWRVVLPWPEEVRSFAVTDDWCSAVREMEREVARDEILPLPFCGGWVGFVGYEATTALEGARPRDTPTAEPAAFFARHRAGVAVSPEGDAFVFGTDVDRRSSAGSVWAPAAWPARAGEAAGPHAEHARVGFLHDSLGDGAHAEAVARIREAIRDGDVYQVNLTRAYSCAYGGDGVELYHALTGAAAPQCSAFLRGDGWSIASASPEVLLAYDRRTGIAESRPIKGTVRRRGDDAAEIAALVASEKDAAEHLMIVDVVRNDFGKIARPGRVSVPAYRSVRTLEHVHHLESTIRVSDLRGASVADLLAALAPAASITGAPKRAAVEMIRRLEPVPRGVYCGAIGMITAAGARFSVAIRTAVVSNGQARYHAGGGIVWESDAALEDDECRAKAAAFLRHVGAGG